MQMEIFQLIQPHRTEKYPTKLHPPIMAQQLYTEEDVLKQLRLVSNKAHRYAEKSVEDVDFESIRETDTFKEFKEEFACKI